MLRPLLYMLYVHSLRYAGLKAKYFMFADDTVLVFPGPDLKELKKEINCDLNLYYQWLSYNKLGNMIIKNYSKKKCDISVVLNGTQLN